MLTALASTQSDISATKYSASSIQLRATQTSNRNVITFLLQFISQKRYLVLILTSRQGHGQSYGYRMMLMLLGHNA
jgi:hypothetical protein